MAKYLTKKEIIRVITEYICDDRRSQAVLLDGEWGSGKTFFVKQELVPSIKDISSSKDQKGDGKRFQVFIISLYGVSKTEDIQSLIYIEWLKQHTKWLNKLGPVGQGMIQSVNALGESAIAFLENKIDLEKGSIRNVGRGFLKQNIGSKKQVVLIFDDIERCRIDIIELMGFLNNLVENNSFKVILVANGSEIQKEESVMERALRYQAALNDNLNLKEISHEIDDQNKKNQGSSFHSLFSSPSNNTTAANNTVEKESLNREQLNAVADFLFEGHTTFEKTREKLIGLTIPYYIDLREFYVDLVTKFIENKTAIDYLYSHKEHILALFEERNHRNLRTFINGCIAFEAIVKKISPDDKIPAALAKYAQIRTTYYIADMVEKEMESVLLYTMHTAICNAKGVEPYRWKPESRYVIINISSVDHSVVAYRFVNEYWETLNIDNSAIYDIESRLRDLVVQIHSDQDYKHHQNLALNKLNEWYLLNDDEVKALVNQMKEELKAKEYYPQEFKEIILVLMRINNPEFGMNWNKEESVNNVIYDSTEDSLFKDMVLPDYPEKVFNKGKDYKPWDWYNVNEFVSLMVKYFENPDGSIKKEKDIPYQITKDMMRVLSDDKQFTYEYREYVKPLMKIVDEFDVERIRNGAGDRPIDLMEWNDDFEAYCRDQKQEFMKQQAFLSLFNLDTLKEHIEHASPSELFAFVDGLRSVYSFSNLIDVFYNDQESVRELKNFVDIGLDGNLNEEKLRTKSIALKRLQSELEIVAKGLRISDETNG